MLGGSEFLVVEEFAGDEGKFLVMSLFLEKMF